LTKIKIRIIEKVRVRILSRENREMKAIQYWNKMKLKGKRKYIFLYGVVRWGLSMGIIMPIVGQIIDSIYSPNNVSIKNFITRLIVSLIVFPLAGYFQSVMLWKRYETKYEE
jgi:hypothetical protein